MMLPDPPWPVRASLPPLPATSFDALLDAIAARRPERPVLSGCDPHAIAPAWTSLTGRQLLHAVSAAAALLQQHGQVAPGDRVAWLGLNHPLQIVLLFALARIGAVGVPLNHRLSAAEWAAVLDDCSPVLLLADDAHAAAATALHARRNGLRQVMPLQALHNPQAAQSSGTADASSGHGPALRNPLLLVYTSGTTGQPKGAVHTQGNLLSNMAIAAQVQGLSPADTVLTVLPLFHVGGLCIQTLPALAAGAHVLLHARFDAGATLASIATDRPTLTLQVPATLQALTQHPRWASTDLSSLRAVWAGSSLLPTEPVQHFHTRGVPVCNVYGSTETGPFSIALPSSHALSHTGSCGWPAPGVEVQLSDASGAEIGANEVGEVWVRAPNVVTHYWPDRPALDATGFFHTGDLARRAPDGSHTVVGRAKDMIISGGENIYPAEIENLLVELPWVAECAVIGLPDVRWGETVVAVVALRDAPAPPEDWPGACAQHLDGRLARYKWPRRWHRLETLPKTALGKVQKTELQRQLSDRPATGAWP
ncbi:MAG: AMP-binding protein [Hydrogenophaga sp.]|jgi:fatty-acyl-CoA synthase|nr:AMP-binding protein [Hydrogenophaga sp.]